MTAVICPFGAEESCVSSKCLLSARKVLNTSPQQAGHGNIPIPNHFSCRDMSVMRSARWSASIITLRGPAAPTGTSGPLSYITETLIIDPNHFSKSPRSEKYFRSFEVRVFSKFSFLIIVKCQTIVLSAGAFKRTPLKGGNTNVKCFSMNTSGRTS